MSDLYYSFPTHFMDVLEKAAHLRERCAALASATAPEFKELSKLYASFAGCMELLARQLPYKAGDRVRLVREPNCDNDWRHSKHFLVVGALGTIKVVEIDYLMRRWSVSVEFDDESWISSGGVNDRKIGDVVPVEPDRRHLYGFAPDYIEHVGEATP